MPKIGLPPRVAAPFRQQAIPHPYADRPSIYGSDAYRCLLAAASAKAGDAMAVQCGRARVTVFMVEVLHPSSGEPGGLIIDMAGEVPPAESAGREELLRRLRDHARRRAWKSFSSYLFPVEADLFEPHGAVCVSHIRKLAGYVALGLPHTRLQIRPATADVHPGCMEMLSAAYAAGMAALGLAEQREEVQRLAEAALDRATRADGLHLVAWLDGEVVGHAIGFLRSQCLKTGLVDAELLDVFTAFAYRAQGFAVALTAHWEDVAWRRGAESVRGTISGPDRIGILRNLAAHGWAEYARESLVLIHE